MRVDLSCRTQATRAFAGAQGHHLAVRVRMDVDEAAASEAWDRARQSCRAITSRLSRNGARVTRVGITSQQPDWRHLPAARMEAATAAAHASAATPAAAVRAGEEGEHRDAARGLVKEGYLWILRRTRLPHKDAQTAAWTRAWVQVARASAGGGFEVRMFGSSAAPCDAGARVLLACLPLTDAWLAGLPPLGFRLRTATWIIHAKCSCLTDLGLLSLWLSWRLAMYKPFTRTSSHLAHPISFDAAQRH